MKARSLGLTIVVAALALAASSLWAQDGLKGALVRMGPIASVGLGTPFSQTLAAADFDGDDKPDGALLFDYGWLRPQSSSRKIEFHFTSRSNAILTFESNETALAISALDVNGDGAPDIVVEHSLTHKRILVWLNDGRGIFHKGRIEDFPSARPEAGDRLESSAPPPDGPAPWLGSKRGSEAASLTARRLLYRSFSARNHALALRSRIGSRAVALNSPRAPPLSQSL